jgi:hypothetical protein
MTKYIVQSASASMPSSVKAPYRRVAILEVNDDLKGPASMISTHSRDVVRIVATWERLHQGWNNGPRTAFARALADAETLALNLNLTSRRR